MLNFQEYFGTDIDEATLEMMAKTIVHSVNVKQGDAVWVTGGLHSWQLVEAVRFHCLLKGVTTTATMTSDIYMKRIHAEVPAEFFRVTPKEALALARAVDAYITLEHPWDPSIRKEFPREKMTAATEGYHPVRNTLLNEKKWCYVGYPTKPMAESFNIPYEDLKRMVVEGMLYNPEKLYEKCQLVARPLKNADSIHVTDNLGTDLTLKVSGRRVNLSDGFISDEDMRAGANGANLPTGEVFIAPLETFGEGTLFCPLTRDRYTNKIIRNLTIMFKDGRLLLDECHAGENEEEFRKTLHNSLEVDEKKYDVIRTFNVAELGVGVNELIDRAIGYILTDEKMGGSVHVAVGDNKSYGGTSESTLHWDFVTSNTETVDVIYADGSSRRILDGGKFNL